MALDLRGREALADLKQRLWTPPTAQDETMSRGIAYTTRALISGTLALNGGCVIRGGVPVTGISFFTSVALVTPTHQWFALIRESDNAVLAKTVDDTNVAWGANTYKALAFAAPYVPTADAAVYIGALVTAATAGTLAAASITNASLTQGPGPWACSADSGLTDPASLGATVSPVAVTLANGYGFIY